LQVDLLQKQYQVLCYWQDTLVLRWHLGMGIQNPTPLPLRVVKMDQYHFLRPSAAAVASGFGCAFLCMRTRVAAAACSNRYTHCTFSLMGAQIRVFSLSLFLSHFCAGAGQLRMRVRSTAAEGLRLLRPWEF
jgi:hypothetical protein